MGAKNGSVMRYILGILGLVGILAVTAWWGSKASFFAEGLTARVCQSCDRNVCPATSASWRELFKKCGGFFAP